MLLILPISVFLGILLLFFDQKNKREAFVKSASVWGLLVTFITETLSLFGKFKPTWIALSWLFFLLIATGIVLLTRKRNEFTLRKIQFDNYEKLLLSAIIFILSIEALLSLLFPPNTWDSMTYHMSRVMHWIQNGSIGLYASNSLRQLYYQPWAEYVTAQILSLTDFDSMANLVQWSAMFGSIVVISLISKEMGADRKTQLFSGFLCATVPMCILQASSTQTDLIAGFWFTLFSFFSIRLVRKASKGTAFFAGTAMGLGLLTKATLYFFCFPVLLFLIAGLFRKNRFPLALRFASIVLITTFLINLPYYYRSVQTFGSPLGPDQIGMGDFNVRNEYLTVPVFLSNVVRNIGIHSGVPSKAINRSLTNSINKMLGPESHNPASTWPGSHFKVRVSFHEDTAGNTIHFFLIISSVSLLFFLMKSNRRLPGLLFLLTGTAFLLFCTFLKWQPFHSRLHTSLFLLSCAPSAVVLSCLPRRILFYLSIFIFIFSVPWLFANKSKPLPALIQKERSSLYFINRPELEKVYREAASMIDSLDVHSIGLDLTEDDWEYPLWVLTSNKLFTNINIGNVSSSLIPETQPIDLIFSSRSKSLYSGGIEYLPIWENSNFRILAKGTR